MKINLNPWLAVIIAFFPLLLGYSQGQTIAGRVLDEESKQPLSYVNIGIPGKNLGTVSNSSGEFKLSVTEKNANDTVKFSIIGYSNYTESTADLKKRSTEVEIYLKKTIYLLKETTVSDHNFTEVIGNTHKSLWLSLGMGKENIGSELGTLVKLRHSPSYLKTAHFSIDKSDNKKLELRLNIYSVSNGMPGNSLLHEPIYIETTLKKGIWSVDLTKYNIEVADDFIMTLEYVKNLDFQGVYFHSIRGKTPSYSRAVSQSNWQNMTYLGKNLSLTFYVDVSY